jgi:hypothetical protein
MIDTNASALSLVERIKRKAPEYLDLLTSETDAEFDKAFDAILERAIIHLEGNSKNYEPLDEEGFSAALAGALMMPGLVVRQEQNSNGHVDLTIEADHCVPARRKLAEAKMYKGPKYHLDGLEQLLSRYTTGREGRGLLIVYVQREDIAGLIQKLRERMDNDKPINQKGQTENHILKWSFISTHTHSCGEDLQVGHVGCNLYVASGAKAENLIRA